MARHPKHAQTVLRPNLGVCLGAPLGRATPYDHPQAPLALMLIE